ncbi:hypothetical protein GIS00_02365 [Nakamurella sp. YIM 132087]|uniref:Uncharacterized protein n=1 Tax=Nakamurella alba TaxID=2665158 RepID=A0A7K1FFB2_9ACTN|nr:hypothetical protein [Nakamurella alba]MTD12788.1 hypothetical protein [Nakamurella alba]
MRVLVLVAVVALIAGALVWGSRSTRPGTELQRFATGSVVMSEVDISDAPVEIPSDQLSETGLGPALAKISWTDYRGETLLLVTTFGSSSCPTYLTDIVATGDQSIRIGTISEVTHPRTTGESLRICSGDLSPLTALIDPPAAVSSSEPLIVAINGFDLTVPARGA